MTNLKKIYTLQLLELIKTLFLEIQKVKKQLKNAPKKYQTKTFIGGHMTNFKQIYPLQLLE